MRPSPLLMSEVHLFYRFRIIRGSKHTLWRDASPVMCWLYPHSSTVRTIHKRAWLRLPDVSGCSQIAVFTRFESSQKHLAMLHPHSSRGSGTRRALTLGAGKAPVFIRGPITLNNNSLTIWFPLL